MRIELGLGLVISAALLAGACGGDDRPDVIDNTVGGSSYGGLSARGGTDGEGGEGGSGEVPVDPRAPIVEVTSPEGLDDPDDGEVLTAGEIDITCTATQSEISGSEPVDPGSVRIEIVSSEGTIIQDGAGVPTDNDDEYSATLVMPADVPNGPVTIRCLASDNSDPPREGRGSIGTFVDQGPRITVIEPVADSLHALQGVVSFEFEVDELPLVDGDSGAEIAEVTLDVNGVAMEVTNDGNTYTADIDFTDASLFPEPPTGEIPVLIRATNSREPEAIVREVGYSFIIDGTGPVINITSHTNNDVVGGQVVLQFTVTDALTGVNKNTVVVEVNGIEYEFTAGDPWTELNGTYSFTFDSRNLNGAVLQLTVNVRAQDNVEIESDGASLTLWLDNQPPAVDLDPADIREFKMVGNNEVCSEPFDPLGTRPKNDEDVIGQLETFRALVWEQTDFLPNQTTFHYAGTNQESVYLYLQSDENTPLLIDTNDDDVCDELATEDADVFLELKGIAPTGFSWYGNDNPTAYPDPALFEPGCTLEGAADPPLKLCTENASDLTRIIRHDWKAEIPVIFAKPELAATECTGQQWVFGPLVPSEGWICFAARAEDLAGNIGISRPLRACYDDDVGDSPSCATASETPPDCTDGCAAPLQVDLGFVKQ
jgi:hypothetical protein